MTLLQDKSSAQVLYEQWASGSGTYDDYFPWDRLSEEDHKRWTMLAKSGSPVLVMYDIPDPADVIRFGDDRDSCPNWRGGQVSMWDLISPPAKELEKWRQEQRASLPPRWQFWRKRPILDLSEQAYWESFLPADGGPLSL